MTYCSSYTITRHNHLQQTQLNKHVIFLTNISEFTHVNNICNSSASVKHSSHNADLHLTVVACFLYMTCQVSMVLVKRSCCNCHFDPRFNTQYVIGYFGTSFSANLLSVRNTQPSQSTKMNIITTKQLQH